MGEKEAKSSRCCLVGVCKYFLFCYPLGKDSSNLGEQRRPKAQKHPHPRPVPLVAEEDCAVCQGCRACKLPPVRARSVA